MALAGFVEDSDYVYLLAATSEGALVWLLIYPDAAEDYAEGAEALQLFITAGRRRARAVPS